MTELLKQGTRIFQGQEALLKNIDAVKELSMITRTSLGPNGLSSIDLDYLFTSCSNFVPSDFPLRFPFFVFSHLISGMNKMVINRLGKLFVTNDGLSS